MIYYYQIKFEKKIYDTKYSKKNDKSNINKYTRFNN